MLGTKLKTVNDYVDGAALVSDAPSPIHMKLLQKYGNNGGIAQYERFIQEQRLSNMKTLRVVPIQYTAPALTCAFDIDPIDSDFLLCGSVQGSIDVLNLNSTKDRSPHDTAIPYRHQHKKMVTGCQWYSDGIGYLITSSRDNTVQFWDLNAQQSVDTYSLDNPVQIHWNEINRKNPLIAVANKESNARLIDMRVASSLQQVRSKNAVTAVRWYPSKQHLLCCGDENGNITYWDVRSGRKAMFTHQVSTSNSKVDNVRFTSDGNWIIVTDTLKLYMYDANSMKLHHQIQLDSMMVGSRPPETPRPIAISEDGECIRVAVAGSEDKIIWIRLPTNIPGQEYSMQYFRGHYSTVTALQYRHGSQELYSASCGVVLAWASPGERAKRSLASETAKHAVQDNWSDDE